MSSLTPVGYKILQSIAAIAVMFGVSFSVMELADKLELSAAESYCDDAVMQTATSPNGKWQAEIHFSNCSLDAPRSWKSYLQLTNLYSGKTFSSTVVAAGRQDALRLEWTIEDSLKISGIKLQELLRMEQPQGVNLEIADPLI